jgi:uncharacterized hydrophobic protein (TIGR00341 family)
VRQIQVDVIEDFEDEAREVLENYSSDISSSEIEKNDEEFKEFSATVSQENIDEITKDLKGLEVESGNLSIRVIEQESLIEKGVKTRGPSITILSSQEIYSKAQKTATFNKAQWALVCLSGALTGLGLSTGNIIVLLGAILMAPILYPLSALSTSIKLGDIKMGLRSSRTAALSILLLFAFSIPVFAVLGSSNMDVLLQGFELVLLSVLVGGAGMLTFISEYREEMAGAALAVAIVPPVGILGSSIATLQPYQALEALHVLTINLLTVIISGYVILGIFGAKPLTKYKLEDAKRLNLLIALLLPILLIALILTL